MTKSRRVTGVDGLRGLAACIVVAHHAALAHKAFADGFISGRSGNQIVDAFLNTPLRLMWAGPEAVYIFFILSGFALTWATLGGPVDWERFAASRLVRLFLPVAAAVAFTWLTFRIVSRAAGGLGFWLDGSPRFYSPSMMLTDASLVTGSSGANTPLWTLTYEVLFSLTLPACLFAARWLRAWQSAIVVVASAYLGAYMNVAALKLLPIFMIGVVLARTIDTWRTGVDALVSTRPGRFIAPLVLVVAILAVVPVASLPSHQWGVVVGSLLYVVSLAGCTTVVMAAIAYGPVERVLSSRPARALGTVSFSLYLVHEPIIKAFAFAFPGSEAALAVAVLASFGVGWAFYWFIERRIHALSRRVRGNGVPLEQDQQPVGKPA